MARPGPDLLTPVLLLFGGACCWFGLPPVVSTATSAFWPRADAKIESIQTLRDMRVTTVSDEFGIRRVGFVRQRVRARYLFYVDARAYRGTLWLGRAAAARRGFRSGSSLRVRYHRSAPSRNTAAGVPWGSVVIVVCGVVATVAALRARRDRPGGPVESSATAGSIR